MTFETIGGQPIGEPEDPIELLLREAREALDQPTALDVEHPVISRQPGSPDRDAADHRHHLMQEAEFHHLFGVLTRAEIVELMLEDEARQKAAALATPDQPYTPSHESDKQRTAAYLARKLGRQE